MKKLLAFIPAFMVLSASAQNADSVFIRRMADQILTQGKAYDDLRVLTKTIGGRLAGSPQMVKAEQWGLHTLQSAGADHAWLQECMVPHWVRGGTDEASANTKGQTRKLDILALGNSQGTGAQPLTAPVIEVDSYQELDAKKDQVKDKIVFYNYHFDPRFVETFKAYEDAVGYRGGGPSKAAQYGARGAIVRSMSESTDNNPHTGSMRYDTAYPRIPAVAIGLQDADWLSGALKQGTVAVTLKTNGHFLPDTIGHNVIAELTGTQFPNEYITIGGHLDSWDPAEGAHDDGTGVVQTIEVLRTLKLMGYKPKHTIRFVLFANEENGSRGGNKYAQEAKAKGEKHILAIESDEGGFTPRGFGISGAPGQYEKLRSWLPLLCVYGGCEILPEGGGTDIGPLARTQQTPVVNFMPDSQRYFDLHHARNDVFEAVNKRELELGAVNIAALVYLVDQYGL